MLLILACSKRLANTYCCYCYVINIGLQQMAGEHPFIVKAYEYWQSRRNLYIGQSLTLLLLTDFFFIHPFTADTVTKNISMLQKTKQPPPPTVFRNHFTADYNCSCSDVHSYTHTHTQTHPHTHTHTPTHCDNDCSRNWILILLSWGGNTVRRGRFSVWL